MEETASIEDCFRLYAAEEPITWYFLLKSVLDFTPAHRSRRKCIRCDENTLATKCIRLSRLPDVLVVHLKRFQVRRRSHQQRVYDL